MLSDLAFLNPFLAQLLTPWGLALVGLCVGSFLNVVVHRLPKMMEAQIGRAHV